MAPSVVRSARPARVVRMSSPLRQAVIAPGTGPTEAPLEAAARLFAALHRTGISYCHWKSNDQVGAGLAGRADIDVLIDRRQADRARAVLLESGFKRFDPMAHAEYPAVEDHLALDEATGRLLHCHLHFRLLAGARFLKGYHLPWEGLLLARRRWEPRFGVFVTDPHLELLVLLVRLSIRLRVRDVVAFAVRRPKWITKMRHESEELRRRIDPEVTRGLCEQLLGPAAREAFEPLLAGRVTLATLWRFRSSARDELGCCRTYGPVRARLLRWRREWASVLSGLSRRVFNRARPSRRSIPTGGVLVALMGADESGMPAVPGDLARLFAWKIDVFRVHFARPSGRGRAPKSPLPRNRAADAVRGLARALATRRRLTAAWQARNGGMLVISDGFPEARAEDDDGPRLTRFATHGLGLLRALARWEAVPYRWAERQLPDLVVRLRGETALSLVRTAEPGAAQVASIADATERPWLGRPAVVVDIDANRPYEEVRRDVARAIWAQL